MKKSLFVAFAALAVGSACGDGSTRTTEPQFKPGGLVKDDIGNSLDASLDAVAEVMPLTLGGANGTTTLYVTPRNGDGKNGCNLTGSTTLVVSVSSSNPAAATVSPTSVTFTACGDTPSLTITPVTQGTTTISVAQTSNNTGATFQLDLATFTVNVAPPPNTAPNLSISGVTEGGSYSKGSAPTATCQVTDTEDGPSSFAATLSAITGPYASDGIGSQTASCSYTDGGGLTASSSATYSIVDPSAPSISYVLSPATADGSNGWYKSSVTLTWTVTETESPNSLQKTGCVDQNITADQAETTYPCSATSAGGSASNVDVKIKRDGTAPVVTATPSPAANSLGWNNGSVTVTYTATDVTSGVASCDPAATLSSEGAGQSATGFCTDNAGNSGSATASGINIDKSAPAVGLVAGPSDGGSYYFGSVPAAPTCSASDALSGVDGSCTVTGYSSAVGLHTVSASAIDKAGNTATATATYTVLAWDLRGFYQPVDAIPTVNTVKNGSTVPLKFNVYAATELTDPAVVNTPLVGVIEVSCNAYSPTDDIEVTTTGATSLRYDVTGKQFILNWQTPKKLGACYKVTMTTRDGSAISALFKLK